jgi:hypothetical protein
MKRQRNYDVYRKQIEEYMKGAKYNPNTTRVYSWHSASMLKSIELPPEEWTEQTINAYLKKRMRERKDRSYKLQIFSMLHVLVDALNVPIKSKYIAKLQDKYLN